ncbi:MAG: hypothetical protein AAFN77_06040 [Planctomycetota bacterium]
MNKLVTKITTFCSFLVASIAMTATASADTYDHIDRMAVDIQTKARLLIRETVHYRSTPQYRQLVAETSKLYRLAAHIHDVTHFEGNLVHLEADLRDLDRCFHRLEALFDYTEASNGVGCSQVRGNTAHVKRLLNRVEDCIHHMQDDVAQLRRFAYRQVARPVTQPHYRPNLNRGIYTPNRGIYNQRGYSQGTCPSSRGYGNTGRVGSGVGFSIGGGSSRIEFRF